MGLKKYIGASIIFIVAICVYVYSVAPANYEITFLDKIYTYSIAIWVAIPLLVLFLASLLHIVFYGLKFYFNELSIKKDESNIVKLLKAKLLKKDEVFTFKNPAYKELGEIISLLDLNVKDEFKVQNSEIEALLKDLVDVKNGTYVQTNYKLALNNEISILNNINKINEQADWSLEVLKKTNEYSETEIEFALKKAIENSCMTALKKVLPNLQFNKEMLFLLLEKDSKESEFNLSKEELLKYISQVELDKKEFLKVANLYSSSGAPDDIISLFEELSNKNEVALDAYVYILFVYEMIDKIRDIFSSTTSEDLVSFRAILELRDLGKHYSLDSIYCLK